MGGQVYLTIPHYLYREGAPAAAERAEARWRAWLDERFAPAVGQIAVA
jgi:hypothetical protein